MSVRKNILVLYGAQLATYVLPFITMPYLSHILGPARFGTLGFAQTVAQIMLILTDFGFDSTSTRKISLAATDKAQINRVYWKTVIVKCMFASVSSLFMVALAFLLDNEFYERPAILLTIITFWGSVLTPSWLFQGLQRMGPLGFCGLFSRVVMLLPLFLFVKHTTDVPLAALLQFLPMMLTGLMMTALTVKLKLIGKPPRIPLRELLEDLKESSHIFFSSAITSVYVYANVIILRVIGGVSSVGFYVAAEKITTPMRQLFVPAIQAYFPKACALFGEGRAAEVKAVMKKMSIVFFFVALVAIIGVQVLGAWFVRIFFGPQFMPTFAVLEILVTVPLLISVASVLVQLGIIASGHQASLKKIYFWGMVFHLIQAPILVHFFDAVGSAYSVFLTELLMAVWMYLRTRSIFKDAQPASTQPT